MGLKKKARNEEVVEKEVAEVVETEKEEVVAEAEVVEAEEVTEEVVEAEEEEVVETESKEVAVRQSTAVSEKKEKVGGANVTSFQKEAAQEGFDLEDVGGFGSFPMIVLGSDGKYECDEEDLGDDPIFGQLQSATNLFMCKQVGVQDGPVAFSSDKVNLNSAVDGVTTIADLREVWKEDGFELEIKKYKEVLIEGLGRKMDSEGNILEDDAITDNFFIMKLPPTALSGFDTALFVASRKFSGSITDRVVKFGVGKKRKTGSGNTYYPWTFKVVS